MYCEYHLPWYVDAPCSADTYLKQRAGTAVYVYFILDDQQVQPTTSGTYFNITLDGQPAGDFNHNPIGNGEFEYDALVYSTEGLPNQNHTVSLSSDGESQPSLLLFDYAIYT